MIPPGLSYLAISQRAWDRMESSYNPRYYFDLRKERKNAKLTARAHTLPRSRLSPPSARRSTTSPTRPHAGEPRR